MARNLKAKQKRKTLKHKGAGRDAYFVAVDLLARREHSRVELENKLLKKGFDESMVALAMDKLIENDLQSDDRYLEDFVRSRLLKGHGPVKIIQELGQRGIPEGKISAYLQTQEIDWLEQAKSTYLKKYRGNSAIDMQEKAKRVRFMQSRGFPGDIIFRLFD